MDEAEDEKLPLHDEAKARSEWRGGETLIAKGEDEGGLPASEVENGAAPEEGDGEGETGRAGWAGLRPPD
jgi:hypothetical protein